MGWIDNKLYELGAKLGGIIDVKANEWFKSNLIFLTENFKTYHKKY